MKFEDLRGWMCGEDCIVMGCGPSSLDWGPPASIRWTIACNRTVLWRPSDIAACFEPPLVDPEIWRIVSEHAPLLVISHVLTNGRGPRARPVCPRAVSIPDKVPPHWWGLDTWMKHPGQSPWLAAAAAAWMGFERIGLIGVDMTGDRYGDAEVATANELYADLAAFLETQGARLVNLATPDLSRLTSIPYAQPGEIRPKNHAWRAVHSSG